MNLDETAHNGTRTKGGDFLKAYAKCGSVSEACRKSGTSRSTHYWRLENFPRYRKAFTQAHRQALVNALDRARTPAEQASAISNATVRGTAEYFESILKGNR